MTGFSIFLLLDLLAYLSAIYISMSIYADLPGFRVTKDPQATICPLDPEHHLRSRNQSKTEYLQLLAGFDHED